MVAVLLLLLLLLQTPQVSASFDFTSPLLISAPAEVQPCVVYSPVTVFFPSATRTIFTCHNKIENILTEFGENPRNFEILHDYVSENGRDIIVVAVTKTRKLVWQKLGFNSQITYTKDLAHRKKVVDTKGVLGLRGTVVEEIVYEDGTVKKNKLATWIEKEPLTEIARVGTQYDLQTKIIDGKVVHYWRTLLVNATSYDKNCRGCNDITATGAKLKKGIVAVDPKVIPMHTQMYVPGYGFGKAEDTGGMIKGNRIDLAYDDIRYGDWSKRWVTIYLID